MNPQAFPQNTVYQTTNGQTVQQGPVGGMTLRDYFAAKAMHAYCSDPTWRETMPQDETAQSAYAMADQMLKAREA